MLSPSKNGITTVLFDLDGTLLPMDMNAFTELYCTLLCQKMAPRGYDPKRLVQSIWFGMDAMMQNDGTRSNEEVFWKEFTELFERDIKEDYPLFLDFYANEFNLIGKDVVPLPKALSIVNELKEKGYTVALATNPLFPRPATVSRMGWAGFSPEDFALFTSFEDDCYCKPNPEYFRHFCERLGVSTEECLMVGNDATEDLAAVKTGMQVFLIDEFLINREKRDLSHIPHGSFEDLHEYIKTNLY